MMFDDWEAVVQILLYQGLVFDRNLWRRGSTILNIFMTRQQEQITPSARAGIGESETSKKRMEGGWNPGRQ
jgi:hypothetical protein